MLIPTHFEGADVYEYAAYLGMRDAALSKKRNPYIFVTELESELHTELRNCYDLAFDMEMESNEFYIGLVRVEKVFIREWDDLRGWGVLEAVIDGRLKKFDFSYHNLTPDMADMSLDSGEVFTLTYRILDEKIISITR